MEKKTSVSPVSLDILPLKTFYERWRSVVITRNMCGQRNRSTSFVFILLLCGNVQGQRKHARSVVYGLDEATISSTSSKRDVQEVIGKVNASSAAVTSERPELFEIPGVYVSPNDSLEANRTTLAPSNQPTDWHVLHGEVETNVTSRRAGPPFSFFAEITFLALAFVCLLGLAVRALVAARASIFGQVSRALTSSGEDTTDLMYGGRESPCPDQGEPLRRCEDGGYEQASPRGCRSARSPFAPVRRAGVDTRLA